MLEKDSLAREVLQPNKSSILKAMCRLPICSVKYASLEMCRSVRCMFSEKEEMLPKRLPLICRGKKKKKKRQCSIWVGVLNLQGSWKSSVCLHDQTCTILICRIPRLQVSANSKSRYEEDVNKNYWIYVTEWVNSSSQEQAQNGNMALW